MPTASSALALSSQPGSGSLPSPLILSLGGLIIRVVVTPPLSGLSSPGMKGRVLAENGGSAGFQCVLCSVDRACNVFGARRPGEPQGSPLSLGQQQGALQG